MDHDYRVFAYFEIFLFLNYSIDLFKKLLHSNFSILFMDESFDREKIIDCMFDPITSEILAKLEDGKKECSVLSQEFSMS